MATTKKQVEFTAKNVKAFTGWLTRFALIDNSLLLEIDQDKSTLIAKTYNEERSVVKMSQIKFDDAGLVTKLTKDPKRIKVGIFNIGRLIKTINQFADAEFTMTIDFQELSDDTETQYAGEKIFLKNKSLKMNLDCTSLNIFKYIPDELFTGAIAKIDTIGKFELSKPTIEKIHTLNALDNDHKFMEFGFKAQEIKVAGKAYDLLIGTTTAVDAEIGIFKDQFGSLDVESYNVALGEDRLVFESVDSETVTVISKAEDHD